jgi:CHAD domain-containing protein
MALNPDNLRTPFRKLRKSLKNMPKQPSPEEVHDLRTRTRRLEAIMHALMLDQERAGKRLVQTIAPIRSKAGKVRDMDVLTGFASTLVRKGEEECFIRLLEHLGAQRIRFAQELHSAVVRKRKNVRRRLKGYSAFIKKNVASSTATPSDNEPWPANATGVALQLSSELAKWPQLKSGNLHPYRLKVKELRYILQLSGDPDDQLVDALGEVKDAIGEWHDWTELASIATEVLDHGRSCNLLKQIRSLVKAKLNRSLSIANALRKSFHSQHAVGGTRRGARRRTLKNPVLTTAARLAA